MTPPGPECTCRATEKMPGELIAVALQLPACDRAKGYSIARSAIRATRIIGKLPFFFKYLRSAWGLGRSGSAAPRGLSLDRQLARRAP
jgi:hypothetical protein